MSKRYNAATEAWAQTWSFCWRCGQRGAWPTGGLVIHHIVRGTSKQLDDVRTTAMLCQPCHDKEHFSLQHLGLVRMLALKKRHDRANYDLRYVCVARGRATGAITEAEVDAADLEGAERYCCQKLEAT